MYDRLLREIIGGVWMIREQEALGLMPFVQGLMSGTSVAKPEVESAEIISAESSAQSNHVIAIVQLKNVITKYSNCGSMGLVQLEKALIRLDSDKSVDAIILDIDTPGGAASYLPNVRATMEKLTTPIFTHYSGLLCSAGYYIASGTQEIFASTKTDIVGSIGTMISFAAANPNKTDPDTIVHTIYANGSEEKNKAFGEAIEGRYDLIREQMLNPMNETFHSAVLSGRPGVDKNALKGSTYMSEEGMKMGLIDGVKTLEEVVQYVYDVLSGDQQIEMKFNYKLKSNNNMKSFFEKVSSIVGREVVAMEDLNAEEYALVNEKLNLDPESASVTPTIQEQINESVKGEVSSAMKSVQPAMTAQEIEALVDARVAVAVEAAIEGEAATTANPGVVTGEEKTIPSWEDPKNPNNAYLDAQFNG